MVRSREKNSLILAVALLSTALLLGSCTSIKYSYEPAIGFSGFKSYMWTPSSVFYGGQDLLLEANVQVLADQVLGQKGLTRVADQPDLLIAITYEPELGYAQYGYQVRMLTLNMYKADKKELVWRGTASGSIHTDAASGDLKHAVQGILSNFPPK
ncbi:MAG TPA: DUF4136 domain-containing protein [Syntrophorhabdales bacterium]|nr:DUF4136 domain-containing protein [Syntrophorhabdales bacterium]